MNSRQKKQLQALIYFSLTSPDNGIGHSLYDIIIRGMQKETGYENYWAIEAEPVKVLEGTDFSNIYLVGNEHH